MEREYYFHSEYSPAKEKCLFALVDYSHQFGSLSFRAYVDCPDINEEDVFNAIDETKDEQDFIDVIINLMVEVDIDLKIKFSRTSGNLSFKKIQAIKDLSEHAFESFGCPISTFFIDEEGIFWMSPKLGPVFIELHKKGESDIYYLYYYDDSYEKTMIVDSAGKERNGVIIQYSDLDENFGGAYWAKDLINLID